MSSWKPLKKIEHLKELPKILKIETEWNGQKTVGTAEALE